MANTNVVDGYVFKIVARLGLAANVPTLIAGEIGYDTDEKTLRVGDASPTPPRIITTKSSGVFDYVNLTYMRLPRLEIVPGGKVDGVDISTMNQQNGLVVRTADGVLTNRKIINGNDTVSVVNGDGVAGDIDIRISDSLIQSLRPPKHWVSNTAPSDPVIGDHWHDTSETDYTRVYYYDTDGITEFWTLLSDQFDNATETQAGVTRYSTDQEALDRALSNAALTPKNLTAVLGAGIDFRPVLSATVTAPPGSPVVRDAYLIPISATGDWASHIGKLATFNGATWVYEVLRIGAVVVDSSKGLSSNLRYLQQTATQTWNQFIADDTNYGFARKASNAEVLARSGNNAYLTPEGLNTIVQLQPLYPEITTNNGVMQFTPSTGQLIVNDTAEWQHRGLSRFLSSAINLAGRTFATTASKTYHLVWDAPGTGNATPASTYPGGRFSLIDRTSVTETDPQYDTTYDRMLCAAVVTNGSNVLTVSALLNKQFLKARYAKTTFHRGLDWGTLRLAGYVLNPVFNWSRTPQLAIEKFSCDASNEGEAVVGIEGSVSRYRLTDYMCYGYMSPLNGDGQDYISGTLTMSLTA